MINGGFFVLSPAALDTIDGDDTTVGDDAARTPGGHGPAPRLAPRRLLAADGHPAGEGAARGALGVRAGAVEGLASEPRLVGRPAGARDRAHRIQGSLALPVARSARRRGHGPGPCGRRRRPPSRPRTLAPAPVAPASTSGTGAIGRRDDGGGRPAGHPPPRRPGPRAPGYADPAGTWAINVLGTANVLEGCPGRRRHCASVVVVTSDKVYANAGDGRVYRRTTGWVAATPTAARRRAPSW